MYANKDFVQPFNNLCLASFDDVAAIGYLQLTSDRSAGMVTISSRGILGGRSRLVGPWWFRGGNPLGKGAAYLDSSQKPSLCLLCLESFWKLVLHRDVKQSLV